MPYAVTPPAFTKKWNENVNKNWSRLILEKGREECGNGEGSRFNIEVVLEVNSRGGMEEGCVIQGKTTKLPNENSLCHNHYTTENYSILGSYYL